jgi:predicted enzyme related to lactoylglutathione lyase
MLLSFALNLNSPGILNLSKVESKREGKRLAGVVAFLLLSIITIVGCAGLLPTVPPLGEDNIQLPGKVVWHDLITPDIEKAKVFYSGLFGWTFEDVSSGYTIVSHNGRLIAGLARLDMTGRPGHWLALVSVMDVDQALSKAISFGATIVRKPFDLPKRGRIAVLRDPKGAAFGIIQSSQGDPKDRKPDLNGWLWNEIWTDDIQRAAEFYRNLLEYEEGQATIGGHDYVYLKRDGVPRLGLLAKPNPEIKNTWIPYIRVEDVHAVTRKVRSLGGEVLMAPRPDIRSATVAIITDPSGAGLIVQEWAR